MDFQTIAVLLVIAILIPAKAEENDTVRSTPNITPESVIEDLRNSTVTATEGKSRVKRQFGGYGYPDPYYGRRRIYPYPPIIFGGIGFGGGPGFGRGFGGRGFGGRGVGRGGGFGGRGGGFGGGHGGGHGGGGGRG